MTHTASNAEPENTTPKPDTLTLFKMLSDNTRLSILLLLKSRGQLCVCELEEGLKADQPKVSRHLGLLRNAGLLQTNKQGKWVYYAINDALPEWANQVLALAMDNSQAKIEQLAKGLNGCREKLCC